MSEYDNAQRPIIIHYGPKRNSFQSCMGCFGAAFLAFIALLVLLWALPSHEAASPTEAQPVAVGSTDTALFSLPPEKTSPVTDDSQWASTIPANSEPTGDGTCDRPVLLSQTESLDGGYVYQRVCRWATSDDIIQARKSDGRRREVAPGNSVAVIRDGPWRGFLIIMQHRYGQNGSTDGYSVIRPDGKAMLQIPPSNSGDDMGEWLRKNGWTAS